jgi:hypothetical protein
MALSGFGCLIFYDMRWSADHSTPVNDGWFKFYQARANPRVHRASNAKNGTLFGTVGA